MISICVPESALALLDANLIVLASTFITKNSVLSVNPPKTVPPFLEYKTLSPVDKL